MTFDQSKIDRMVTDFLELKIQEIISNIDSTGQTASGDTARSIEVVKVGSNEWLLVGRAFIDSLERGRGPTGSGSGSGQSTLQEKIYDWLPFADKYGITYDDDGERVSLSWAISKKIHKEGTKLYKEGKATGVLENVLNSKNFAIFVNTMLSYYGGVIMQRLRDGISS